MIRPGSAVLAMALLIAACSTDTPTTTTTTTTLAPGPTTTADPTTTTTTTTTSPSTTVSSEAVGSAELKEALIDEIVAEVGEANLGGRENIPFLDINNPDPLVAMQSIIAFDSWVATTWPDPPMVSLYTVEGSQGRSLYERGANSTFKGGSRIVYLADPYIAENYEIVEPNVVLPVEVLAELPRGAIAISYDSSSGPFEVRRVEDDSVDASSDGWEKRNVVTVISPTAVGWQIWYEASS